jgi:hypothetical protein
MNKAQLTHFSHCDSAFFLHFITKDELNRADTIVPLWFSFFLHCITTDELSTTDTFKPLWLGLFFTSSLQMNRAELIYLNRCDSALYTHYQCRWAEQNWYIEPLWLSSLLTSSLQMSRAQLIPLNHCDSALYSLHHHRWAEENWYIEPLWLSSLLTSSLQTNRGELIHWTIVTQLFTHFITTDEPRRTDTLNHCDSPVFSLHHHRWVELNWYN